MLTNVPRALGEPMTPLGMIDEVAQHRRQRLGVAWRHQDAGAGAHEIGNRSRSGRNHRQPTGQCLRDGHAIAGNHNDELRVRQLHRSVLDVDGPHRLRFGRSGDLPAFVAAERRRRCYSDAELARIAGLATRNQAAWRFKKLIETKRIRSRVVAGPDGRQWRIVTIVASSRSTRAPTKPQAAT